MEEAASPSANGTGEAATNLSRDLRLLTILVIVVALLRAWLLVRTEVPARDSIGFIRYALEFEKLSWSEVLNKNHQHPGYPFALLTVSQPIRYLWGTDSTTMQVSAQLTSAICSVLLVIPMFLLGRAMFSAQVGFWAALLFQFLPVSGHHLSDGISEPLFLLLTSTTLWLGLRALRDPSALGLTLCGLFCGLTYLTRPEGALLLAAVVGTMIIKQFGPTRLSWSNFAQGVVAVCLTAIAAGSCYFGFTGKFTNKPSVHFILRGQPTAEAGSEDVVGSRPTMGSRPMFATVFAITFERRSTFFARLQTSIVALCTELAQSFHYMVCIPFVLGMFWYWRNLTRPECIVVLVFCALHTTTLLMLATSLAYVSDRHTMSLVMCGCFPAAAAIREIALKLAVPAGALWARMQWVKKPIALSTICTCLLFFVFISTGVSRVLQPLHHNRAGYHAAGLWLAQKVQPGDSVIDDHCWAHYYAGELFREELFRAGPLNVAADHEPKCYVVVARSKDPEVKKQRDVGEAHLRSHGEVVYHWPQNKPQDQARVVVYAVAKRDLVRAP